MVPEASPEKGMNEFQRLSGVVFDPKAAFSDIAARPRWWAPLLLIVLTSVTFIYCFSQRVGWEGVMREQMESNSRMQQLSPEQKERIVEQQMKFAPVGAYGGAVVMIPVSGLVMAGVLLLVFKVMLGGNLTFKQLFAISFYAWIPNVIAGLLSLIVLFAKPPEDFNINSPLMFNVGAFLATDTPRWLKSFAPSIDLFSIWTMLLLATGISAADRKLSWGSCLTWVVMCWLVWVIGKAGFAAAFS